jgi:hypothetical protein
MLEQALAKLAGENWQVNPMLALPKVDIDTDTSALQSSLDLAPATISSRLGHKRGNSVTGSPLSVTSSNAQIPTPNSAHSPPKRNQEPAVDKQQTLAHIEQIRLLVLGMEQRLETREEKLVKTMERAEGEGRRFDQLRKEISSGTD